MRALCLLVFLIMPAFAGSGAGTDEDKKAVREAILHYVEALYEVSPERIDKGVDPSLRKVGFWMSKDGYKKGDMTFDQLKELAGKWNKKGKVGKDSVKEITVYEVMDKTASAKLVAHWGMDYFHLAKMDGEWRIVNVMWQSLPKEK